MKIAPLIFFASLLSLGALQAQTILMPTGSIYESSQDSGNSGAQNLFDGTTLNPPSNTTTNTNSVFAAYGTTGYGSPSDLYDENPVVAFSLGALYTTSSVYYSQRGGGGHPSADSITSGTVYTLTMAQYTTYTSGLLVSNDAAGANEGSAQAAPTSYLGMATFTPTTASGNSGYANYALSSTLTGQYFVVQFTGDAVDAYTYGGNPGGAEFEIYGSAVPEPSPLALLGLGLGGVFCLVRPSKKGRMVG